MREVLCNQIRSIYPDIGACGIDVEVGWDEDSRAWVVDLRKDGHELMTYLNPDDVKRCLEGKECVHLGVQIAQLKGNITRQPKPE
jgi:hypothetical protein